MSFDLEYLDVGLSVGTSITMQEFKSSRPIRYQIFELNHQAMLVLIQS